MATFGEIVYFVLDNLKERSNDAYYTEEHVIFLANKMRALLLERKYKNSRNQTFTPMSDENKQQICLDLEPTDILPYGCSGMWLKSTEKIPSTIGASEPTVSIVSDMLHSMVTFIPAERMPYVGYNKWLKNIVYAAKSNDGYLYLNGSNPQFMYLRKAKVEGVFSDPEEAAALSCDGEGNPNACNILEAEFPLEQSLVPSCIELIVQELIGSRYAPEDKDNDAKDGLGEMAVASNRASRPVENSTYKPREAATE